VLAQVRALAQLRAMRPRAAEPRPVVPGKSWYRIEARADGPAEVWIYDEIGYWGTTADEFCRDLALLDASEVLLRVNSPGGDVFDGLAIYNALLDHPAHVTARVDGLAASAASFLIQAADQVTMGRQSQMMIHDASGLCLGNASDMVEMGGMLDRISDSIAAIYNDRAKGGQKSWRARMRAETWYSAQEAVDAGLADAVMAMPKKRPAESEPDGESAAAASWDLSVFRYAGREKAPTPANSLPEPDPAPEPTETPPEPAGEPVVVPEPAPPFPGDFAAAFRGAVIAASEVPFDAAAFREQMQAAAGWVPADPDRAAHVPDLGPLPPPAAEPDPDRPLTLAEFFRAAVVTAAVDVPAPTVLVPEQPVPAVGPVFDSAALRRAVREARL
jgi:ATP-dependent protease ClpP protease subunit